MKGEGERGGVVRRLEGALARRGGAAARADPGQRPIQTRALPWCRSSQGTCALKKAQV